jgi:hypothetical protein
MITRSLSRCTFFNRSLWHHQTQLAKAPWGKQVEIWMFDPLPKRTITELKNTWVTLRSRRLLGHAIAERFL